MMTLMCLSLPVAAAQSLAPLNVAELSALLGNFGAVIVTAPASAKRAAIQAVSQLGAASDSDSGFYRGSHTLTVYDLKTPVRLIVGLAGDPIGRGGQAATLSLPGIQPCTSDQQLAVLGASTATETNVSKQCLGMGTRADGMGGGAEPLIFSSIKLNVWTPVYRWYFLAGSESSDAAFTEARWNPAAQIVWWVYFSSAQSGDLSPVPLYTPKK